MTYLQAILLGIVQGITEFLPISSDGHLVIFQHLFGLKQDMMFFDVMVHFATLLVVFVYFRRDIAALIATFFGRNADAWPHTPGNGRRVVAWIVLGTIPAVFVGLFLKDAVESTFKSVAFAGGGLLFTALLLTIGSRAGGGDKESSALSPAGALAIGIAQAIAPLPGVSRSGSTIATGLLLKLDRKEAARFSFLLAIPAILGATVLELKDVLESGISDIGPVLVGMVVAFIAGMFALNLLVRVLQRGKLIWFAGYCVIAGIVAILLGIFS